MVKRIAGTVEAVATVVVTGKYDFSQQKKLDLFSWNHNGNGGAQDCRIPIQEGIDCFNCFAHAGLTINMELHISNHQLDIAEISASGSIEMNTQARAVCSPPNKP